MRKISVLFGVCAVALAALASLVSPASAAPQSQNSAWCVFYEQSATFNSLARVAPTSTAPGGRLREKATRGVAGFDAKSTGAKKPSASFSATIPVYFHVITDGDIGSLSEDTINEQMNVLNLAFGGLYGGVNTRFQFELASVDYTDNGDWYNDPEANELAMKTALKQGGPTELDVYSTSGGAFLGWAYYPTIVTKKKYQVLDGIVIDGRSTPGGPYGDAFSLGQTLTHEAGHYLGLAHTFEQGCIGHGDFVDDTPAEAEPTSGCPRNKDTCREPGLDPIHNYMDYSFDRCYNQFTAGQTGRMQQQWSHWRVKHGYS
jgi:hypothetical protein